MKKLKIFLKKVLTTAEKCGRITSVKNKAELSALTSAQRRPGLILTFFLYWRDCAVRRFVFVRFIFLLGGVELLAQKKRKTFSMRRLPQKRFV